MTFHMIFKGPGTTTKTIPVMVQSDSPIGVPFLINSSDTQMLHGDGKIFTYMTGSFSWGFHVANIPAPWFASEGTGM